MVCLYIIIILLIIIIIETIYFIFFHKPKDIELAKLNLLYKKVYDESMANKKTI